MRQAHSHVLAAAAVCLGVGLVACQGSDASGAAPEPSSAAVGAPSGETAPAGASQRGVKRAAKPPKKKPTSGAKATSTVDPERVSEADGGIPASAAVLTAQGAAARGAAARGAQGAGLEGADDEAACPSDMQLVSGDYCRNVAPRCLEYVNDVEGSPDLSRCKRFASPVQCTDSQPRRPMRFCMDRYEWPNKQGELPHTLVSWEDAARLCNSAGKRLCTESEFNFACEGEQLYPHATGYERDANKCNIDREFKKRRREFLPREACEASPSCKAEFERLDGREPAGSRPECVSPFGIHDLNGNVNEWVSMPWQAPGKRSAIKGGWWGPVRNRCRPIVQSHGETYIGYEVGFRCCAAADGSDGASSAAPDESGDGAKTAGDEGARAAGEAAVSLAPAP
ncbi:MAG: SUMF1/EgtB/PvdO family nonheme iron enzyme [Polyangiaceae bacterium]|nr:SUMF1/EgtB/PvdO family nonheme iron enzyme [Polyangiaceae bacterium]MCW5791328.1 SUMF1/EgtB/PvdO family nonheme iron enzyme [Polyangiaceae bacterium]